MSVGEDVLAAVEAHLTVVLGEPAGRAEVTFLGTEAYAVLRFPAPDADGPAVRYATLGMSRRGMADPAQVVADPEQGPRAEFLLTLREPRDSVLRGLAVLAAGPSVEGVVVGAGMSLDLGEPLWPGTAMTAVLVGASGGVVPDLPLAGAEPVQFYPLLPMTPAEAAWKRVHGAAALEGRWLQHGVDLRDPSRRAVPLD